jgi:hypothetical protein
VQLIDQTIFGEAVGNCLAACVATLLELPLTDVPNFCAEHGDGWFPHFCRWLQERDHAALYQRFNTAADVQAHLDHAREFAPNVPWIAGGLSRRGPHACIYLGDRLLHDPFPHGRTGLHRIEDAVFLVRALTTEKLGRIEI